MSDFIVTVDGKAVEVPHDALKPAEGGKYAVFEMNGSGPKGYFDETHVEAERAKVRTAESEKAKGLKNPADLEKDAEFHKRVFKHLGIQVDEKGLPIGQLSQEDRQKLAELDRLRSEHASLKEQNEAYLKEREVTRRQALVSSIQRAFDQDETYLRRDLLKSYFGQTPAFLSDAASQFAWDENHSGFVFRDGDNVVMKDGRPASAEEFARRLKKAHPELFEDRRQNRSTDYRDGGLPPGTRTMKREDFEKLSHAERGRIALDPKVTVVD